MRANSMTGFGRGEARGKSYQLVTEIKSVNHRFKDFRFKMSSVFSSVELDLRELINAHFGRGSFEIMVNFKKVQESIQVSGGPTDLDEDKIEAFISMIQKIAEKKKIPLEIRPTDFLRNEFFASDEEHRKDELGELLKSSFLEAVVALKNSRMGEGEKLAQLIHRHMKIFEENFQVIIQNVDSYQEEIKERINKRFLELAPDLELDQSRLRQEIVYYLDKLDVEEEINRINVHLEKLSQVLKQGDEMGRKIDFLVQELNRETNTIGSKSGKAVISEAVVQMKVQLEKIREQALNLE